MKVNYEFSHLFHITLHLRGFRRDIFDKFKNSVFGEINIFTGFVLLSRSRFIVFVDDFFDVFVCC